MHSERALLAVQRDASLLLCTCSAGTMLLSCALPLACPVQAWEERRSEQLSSASPSQQRRILAQPKEPLGRPQALGTTLLEQRQGQQREEGQQEEGREGAERGQGNVPGQGQEGGQEQRQQQGGETAEQKGQVQEQPESDSSSTEQTGQQEEKRAHLEEVETLHEEEGEEGADGDQGDEEEGEDGAAGEHGTGGKRMLQLAKGQPSGGHAESAEPESSLPGQRGHRHEQRHREAFEKGPQQREGQGGARAQRRRGRTPGATWCTRRRGGRRRSCTPSLCAACCTTTGPSTACPHCKHLLPLLLFLTHYTLSVLLCCK